jgi:hypothetical protein
MTVQNYGFGSIRFLEASNCDSLVELVKRGRARAGAACALESTGKRRRLRPDRSALDIGIPSYRLTPRNRVDSNANGQVR